MFQYAAPRAHARESRRECAAVLAFLVAPSFLDEAGESTPPRAWRVSDHRMRPRIEARIAADVPWLDIGQPEVGATRGDVERGDSHA